MTQFTAIYDACVLYPATLRSFLMYLALEEVFLARWSNHIHEEWMRNVAADHPDLPREKLERIRDLMDAHVLDCLVTDYEPLIEGLDLPDPDDRHVLAAAIKGGAAVIVTANVSDFPDERLRRFGVQAQTPDEFVCHVLDLSPAAVCRAFKRQRESMKNPPKTVDQLLATLEKAGMPGTVAALLEFHELL